MVKLGKDTLPNKHSFSDFEAFGPVAEEDGNFTNIMLCDMGCFTQDGKDTNKGYFGAVLQSKIDSKYYTYFEWGRVGGHKQFQFLECLSKEEAQSELESQLHSKNDKRGEWYTHPVLGKMLRAKKGKDCYLVRHQDARKTNIDAANSICNASSVQSVKKAVATVKSKLHPEIESLLRDLQLGSVAYTKSSITTGDVPSQKSIDEARKILLQAQSTNVKEELDELTRILYSRIPKVKPIGVNITLSSSNFVEWSNDLDAFESAIGSQTVQEIKYNEFVELEYIEKTNLLYSEISDWINSATRNKHSYIPGKMKVLNIYKIHNSSHANKHKDYTNQVIKNDPCEVPLHLPKYQSLKSKSPETNTHLLFHGTRSCNATGILKSGRLILPKALSGVSINGALYGPGCYFADDWKKSAGYASINNSVWARGSGALANRQAFMFLSSVTLGKIKVENGPRGYNKPPAGYNSVMGKAGSYVMNNEFIVYDEDASLLDYLIEFTV